MLREWAWLIQGRAPGWLQRQELVRGQSSPEHHPDATHTALTRLGVEHPEGRFPGRAGLVLAAKAQVPLPGGRQNGGSALALPDSSVLTVTFSGLPEPPRLPAS